MPARGWNSPPCLATPPAALAMVAWPGTAGNGCNQGPNGLLATPCTLTLPDVF